MRVHALILSGLAASQRLIRPSKTFPSVIRSMASGGGEGPSMDVHQIVKEIERFAPPSLAGSWDNVGLLVDPMEEEGKPVRKLFLTNDLTEEVMEECLSTKADMILSYHPPIFRPLKRLTATNWKERIVIQCLVNRIALYSPHTALDAVRGGVNDWLLEPFGPGTVTPLEQDSGADEGVGPGRLLKMEKGLSLADIVRRLKKHLQLSHVRLALKSKADPDDVQVDSIAVCAGSGGSLLVKAKEADLWITGEMSHHEVLDALHHGTAVILCEHSNTERGFLKEYAKRLSASLPGVSVVVSQTDTDPLKVI